MKLNLMILIVLTSFTSFNALLAQTCPFSGGFSTATGDITTTPGTSNCFDRAFSIGDNVTMTGLIIGGQYSVDVCGEPVPSNHPATYDSYIGIWTTGGGAFLTESLGGTCGDGNDESVTFTATATSHVAVLRNEACGGGFSLHDLCVTYVSAPLPVELIEFSVRLEADSPVLSWRTASEQNNEKFEIERSPDGKAFHKIGEIDGKGTTTVEQQYYFRDRTPLYGMVYYRLKQIDYDGLYEYSHVVSVDIISEGGKVGDFYPNPNQTGLANLEYYSQDEEEIAVLVFDLTGKLVSQQMLEVSSGNNNLSFDFSALNTGVYLVKLSYRSISIHRKIVIK